MLVPIILEEYFDKFNEWPIALVGSNLPQKVCKKLLRKAIKSGNPLTPEQVEDAINNTPADTIKQSPSKRKKLKYTIKLMNEFMHGLVWVYDDEEWIADYDLIDEDIELQILNNETADLFSTYFEFDSHDQGCWINDELMKQTKGQMLELIRKIKERLAIVNDGSFIVEDLETERVRKL